MPTYGFVDSFTAPPYVVDGYRSQCLPPAHLLKSYTGPSLVTLVRNDSRQRMKGDAAGHESLPILFGDFAPC
jgi:hypothetical protein